MKHHLKNEELPSPEELFTEYGPLILRTVSKYLSNPDDCRECVNDTFLEFYKHPERYNPKKGSLAAYLSAIAGKKAISKWRKLKRAGRILTFSAEDSEKLSAAGEGAGTAGDPAEQIAEKMDLEKALSALSAEELDLIRQKYYDGRSIREIADQMQVPYETVKKRHQRTLKKLRLMLLIITVLAALAGCVFFLAKKAGIVPGYGEVKADMGAVYRLEEPVSVPVPGTDWEARITMALYQGEYLTIRYYITDSEGRRLTDEELGEFYENLGETVWDYEHSMTFSVESFLYIGLGHYEDFEPLETTYIGNQGPGYYDNWLAGYGMSNRESKENGGQYTIWEPVWENDGLPAVLGEGEEITVTLAADLILTEKECGMILESAPEYNQWSRQLYQEKHRFETDLTLKAVFSEEIENYAFDYDEERGGVLAMPYLQDGHLIAALYPLQGKQGRIAAGLVTATGYTDDFEIGSVTAVAEDGTVLTGTRLGNIQSDARLYSEWDFGPAEPGTYRLQIPYLLKTYDGGDKHRQVSIPFSLKGGTISGREVKLGGFRIRASNLSPIDWEDLLSGTSSQAAVYYQIKDSPFYNDASRLWTIELETKSPYADETVVVLNYGVSHKKAYFFPVYGDPTGIGNYDIPEDGKFKLYFMLEDAENRMSQNLPETWSLDFHLLPYMESIDWLSGGITTRWEHPVELVFTVE